jgi:hypothetical protein
MATSSAQRQLRQIQDHSAEQKPLLLCKAAASLSVRRVDHLKRKQVSSKVKETRCKVCCKRTSECQLQDLAVWSSSSSLSTFQVEVSYTEIVQALVDTASCLPSVEKATSMHMAATFMSPATLMLRCCCTASLCSERMCTVPSEQGHAAIASAVLCLHPNIARSRQTLGMSSVVQYIPENRISGHSGEN